MPDKNNSNQLEMLSSSEFLLRIEKLPKDVFAKIFDYLSVGKLLATSRVSHTWEKTINFFCFDRARKITGRDPATLQEAQEICIKHEKILKNLSIIEDKKTGKFLGNRVPWLSAFFQLSEEDAFMQALFRNDISLVITFIDAKLFDVNYQFRKPFAASNIDFYTYAPIHIAIQKGYVELTQALLERGANIHQKFETSRTGLTSREHSNILAIAKGKPKIKSIIYLAYAEKTLTQRQDFIRLAVNNFNLSYKEDAELAQNYFTKIVSKPHHGFRLKYPEFIIKKLKEECFTSCIEMPQKIKKSNCIIS